jgi:hypothetical protein
MTQTSPARSTPSFATPRGFARAWLFAAAAFILAAVATPAVAAPTKAPPKAAKAKGSTSLDSLMNDGVSDKKKSGKNNKELDSMLKEVQKPDNTPAPKKEPEKELPSLSQSDIRSTMTLVKQKAHDCATSLKAKGFAEMKITVGKDGKVAKAIIGGKLAGTPLAACVEKVTRATKFPESKGLTFDYRLDVR